MRRRTRLVILAVSVAATLAAVTAAQAVDAEKTVKVFILAGQSNMEGKATNGVPEFKGNVKAFRTDLLVDKEAGRLHPTKDPLRKMYVGHEGYHYFGSPIWYTRIGRAEGEAMLELLKSPGK